MFDYHIHSEFSDDSSEKMSNIMYINIALPKGRLGNKSYDLLKKIK
ncbi:MAG: hypothetical protein WBG30_03860 [Psychrilyobacter sp.]